MDFLSGSNLKPELLTSKMTSTPSKVTRNSVKSDADGDDNEMKIFEEKFDINGNGSEVDTYVMSRPPGQALAPGPQG